MSNDHSKITLSKTIANCCSGKLHPSCPSDCSNQDFLLSDGVNIKIEPGKEVNHDFSLHPNPYKDCGTLSGIVKDKHGCPIQGALVKIFDQHHKPVAHVFTNKEGQFLVCLKPGHYIVKAVK